MNFSVVGTSPDRLDAYDKACGISRYTDDEPVANLLHGAIAFSPCSHGILKSLDVSKARALPGVVKVVTAADMDPNRYFNCVGAIRNDQPLIVDVGGRLRWRGDRIAIIAAETPEIARQAAKLVECTFEELPVIHNAEEALKPETVKLHEGGNLADSMCVRHGDVEEAFKNSPIILDNRYEVGYQEHAYLETNSDIAFPQPDGGILIRGSMQAPFYVQGAMAKLLRLPRSKIRVQQATTGGGFGGKEDYPNEPSAVAAVLAFETGRPVKVVLNREEDLAFSTKRHTMVIEHKLAAKEDGTITAIKVRVLCDAGAYLGISSIVAERANASSTGQYRVPNLQVDTLVVYTNNAFGGAYRGFGAPQVTFATERQMDLLAEKVGVDPIEIRRRNTFQAGEVSPLGDVVESDINASRVLEMAAKKTPILKKVKASKDAHIKRGIGMAAVRYGVGLHAGGQRMEGSGSLIQINIDGSVRVNVGGAELGQGCYTAMAMIAAEALGVDYKRIYVGEADTMLVPDSGPTVASRTTIMSGNAVKDGCQQLKDRLLRCAAKNLGCKAAELDLKNDRVIKKSTGEELLSFEKAIDIAYGTKVSLVAAGWYAPDRKIWNAEVGQGQSYTTYAHAVMVAEVAVDTITGKVTVEKMHAIHDVGQAIHHNGIIGQIQGGVVQGMGWATMEELVIKEGKMLNPNFTDYIIPTIKDMPEIAITLLERPYKNGPFGAKGIGEPSLIPVGAAVANAVANAVGKPVFELPVNPERIKLNQLQ